jgi:phospholipid/cholesterol/gamma-HCH transport system substrate-binding protein
MSAFRLGLFIVATLLILTVGVFLIGGNESRFARTYRVRAEFRTVAGLDNGAEVRVGGIHSGTVKRIDLPPRPDGNVAVVMDLRSATHDVVRKDSVAAIRSEGLLGDKYVEISFGSPEAAKLKENETLQSEAPFEFSQLMKKADQILDTAKGAAENIQESAGNLSSISAKINRGQGTVGALINDKTVYKEAAAGATELQENMEALKHNFFLRGYFKKRGYEDAADLTKHEISQLPRGPVLKTFSYDSKQIFDKPDTAKLKDSKVLTEAGKFLEAQKFGLAVVAASAGMKGDSEESRRLTEARSMVVRDFLVNNFRLDDTRIRTIGLGKTEQPDSGNADSSGNVKILIYPDASNPPASALR